MSAGSRTWARNPAVNAVFGGPRGPQSRFRRRLDHRGKVLIWIMRVCVAEAEEAVVLIVSCGVVMSRSAGSP